MVTRDGKQLARESKETCQIAKPQAKQKVSPLRKRMIRDMELAGHRLISMDESHVTLKYKDHDTGQWKTERLEGVQFLRRFLFHVLPKGFHKVRYYGLWHPCKKDRQAQARLLLELIAATVADTPVALVGDLADEALGQSSMQSHGHSVKCPKCGGTNILLFEKIRRGKSKHGCIANGRAVRIRLSAGPLIH